MTRTYAAKRLLEHGPLTSSQLIEITGWSRHIVKDALHRLCKFGIVRHINIERTRHYALIP